MPKVLGSSEKVVIGVLTPHTGGFYYGAVINGILETVRQNDAVAIAFETSRLQLLKAGQVLSSAVVDGWLAVNEFSDAPLLAELRARGAPIVHLHSKPDVATGSAVLPDNEGGARTVTEHLIGHGHRKIAFAGNLGHPDIAERFLGYRAALRAAGIEPDEDCVFNTAHHKELDGRVVAEQLIARRRESLDGDLPVGGQVTALVAATDRLALGAMDALLEGGLEVPADFAIVGFDDADAAQFAEPALTTVKQSFTEAAACAVVELLDSIREGRRPHPVLRVPTQSIVRRSCGCQLSHSIPPRVACPAAERVGRLTAELLALAGRSRLRNVSPEEWPEAEKIAVALEATARGQASDEAVRGDWWAGFLTHGRDAESAVRVMELLESRARAWSVLLEEQPRVWSLLRELRVALMHQWQRAERVKVAHYESLTEAAYRLTNSLSSASDDPSRDLGWIRWSNAHRACCALWTEYATLLPAGSPSSWRPPSLSSPPAAPSSLHVTGEFAAIKDVPWARLSSSVVPPEQFPPQQLLQDAYDEGAIVSIAGVPRGRGAEYGLLAVVAPLAFEHLEYVGTPGDWGVQLGAALDRAQVERELRASAELDALTGLANRATLLHRLEQLRAAQDELAFAVLFIDLDDFKKINDSLGHEAGDQLLLQIAGRLTQEVLAYSRADAASQNLVARVGGDEFVVVLAGIDCESDAVPAVQMLQERLRQPYALQGRTVFVSASIGVNFGRRTESSAQELLRDADTAMYRAKVRGSAQHEIFHHGMHAQAVEKLHLDARLRLAIEHNELELWYQPIIDLAGGADVGAEALIRWRDPEQGLIPPGRFLPIAEDVGLAVPISEWVIRRVCSDVSAWQQSTGSLLYVNINVPAAHIKHPGFVEFVEGALEESGLRPGTIGIELVESALLDEPDQCALALSRLRDSGVRIAIDDFGTGYSNLSYLRDFPVSSLKIDRSFVKNVPGDARDDGIVRAIIAMGQQLGLSLVAEGIETQEQYQFLRQAGCDYAQGYLMSVPLELSAYVARLSRGASVTPPTSGRRPGSASDWPEARQR